jgi:hypothetical protein
VIASTTCSSRAAEGHLYGGNVLTVVGGAAHAGEATRKAGPSVSASADPAPLEGQHGW